MRISIAFVLLDGVPEVSDAHELNRSDDVAHLHLTVQSPIYMKISDFCTNVRLSRVILLMRL